MSQLSRASSNRKTFITWTPFMDKCMADILIEQVNLGVKSNHDFRATTMNAVAKAVGERFHIFVDVNNCRNRLQTLYKHFQLAKEVLNKSGFNWDDERKCVTAEEEVWKEFIKLHPDASKIKNKPFPLYHDMEIICGEENAMGNMLNNAIEFANEAPPHHPMDDISISSSPFVGLRSCTPLDDDFSEETYSQAEEVEGNADPNVGTSAPRQVKRKKLTLHEDVMQRLDCLCDTIDKYCKREIELPRNVWKELKNLKDINDDLMWKASGYLARRPNLSRLFLSIEPELRHIWLEKTIPL